MTVLAYMIEQVASNKSSLLLKMLKKTRKDYNYLQRQSKQKVFTKIIKMPSLRAWAKKPNGLIKRGRKRKHFKKGIPRMFNQNKYPKLIWQQPARVEHF